MQVRRKSRSRSRSRSPRRFASKSRSPIRYRKHPSPSSDGSFQKTGRARSRSWSRGRGKGKSKEKDPREVGRDQQAGPTEIRPVSFSENRQKATDLGSSAASQGTTGEKSLPAQTPTVEACGKGRKEPLKQTVQRTKQKDGMGPNSTKMAAKIKPGQVVDRRAGSMQQTTVASTGVPNAVAPTPPSVQHVRASGNESQKSTGAAASVGALRPVVHDQPNHSPAAAPQPTGDTSSGLAPGVPLPSQPKANTLKASMGPVMCAARGINAVEPSSGVALQSTTVPPVAAKSKSSIPFTTGQSIMTHTQPGKHISSGTPTHSLTAATFVNQPRMVQTQNLPSAQHHAIQGTTRPSPSSTPVLVHEPPAARGPNLQHVRMPASTLSSTVSVGQGIVTWGPSYNARPAGLPWSATVHQPPLMHQAHAHAHPNLLLSAPTSTSFQQLTTGIRHGIQNPLPPPPPPPVTSGCNSTSPSTVPSLNVWHPAPASKAVSGTHPSSHASRTPGFKTGSVEKQEQVRLAGMGGKDTSITNKNVGGLPQTQHQGQPLGTNQVQAQNGNNGEDDSDDDGCTFSQLEPGPLPSKTPTLNVFKGPPHLLARSKQLCHNALTMCTPMVRLSGKLGDLREALWEAFPYKSGEKYTVPPSKIAQVSNTLTKDLLAFRSIRKDQKVFRMLAGEGATTSTTHWHKIDPWWALCNNETMKGSCDISQCSYQHMKNMEITARWDYCVSLVVPQSKPVCFELLFYCFLFTLHSGRDCFSPSRAIRELFSP